MICFFPLGYANVFFRWVTLTFLTLKKSTLGANMRHWTVHGKYFAHASESVLLYSIYLLQ
jgi:hypothetical protein